MPRVPASRQLVEVETPGVAGSALALAARRPIDTLAGALAGACAVMIFVNALLIQEGRPSPEKTATAPHAATPAAASAPQRAEAPKRSDLVMQVQTALAERDLYDGVVDGLPGAATSSAIRAFEKAQGLVPTGEASERVLAALLTAPMRRSEASAPATTATRVQKPATAAAAAAAPTSTGSTSAPNPTLMAAQKALAKIGYGPVTIDGKLGAETRNAIRSFERDRGMPETGEASPAVMRALQALTGAPLR